MEGCGPAPLAMFVPVVDMGLFCPFPKVMDKSAAPGDLGFLWTFPLPTRSCPGGGDRTSLFPAATAVLIPGASAPLPQALKATTQLIQEEEGSEQRGHTPASSACWFPAGG